MTDDTTPPDVEEALHRLRGRRADAIVNASTARVVEETKGQNRRTRRNNLRLARLEVKARRRALNAVDGALVDGEPVT